MSSLASRILSIGKSVGNTNEAQLQPVAKPVISSITERVTFSEDRPFDFGSRQLHEVVMGEDYLDTNEPTRHNDHFIHVSDLKTLCPRAYVLAVRHKAKVFKTDYLKRVYSASTKVTWVQGRATEQHIRSQFIKRFAKQVYGTWECPCQNSRYVGFFNPDISCGRCGKDHIFFETPIYDLDKRIVGTADLPVVDSTGLVFVELKSMKKDDFVNLEAPLPEHITQALTYRDMAIRNQFIRGPISKYICVLYAAKEFVLDKSAYKEFRIDTESDDYDFARATMNIWYSRAEVVRQALRNGTLPPLIKACSGTKITTQMKECPLYVNCMSLR